MLISEITIAVLVGILVIISSIYLTYFSIISLKKMKERYENGGGYEEDKKKSKILSVGLIIYFALSSFIFITNLTYRTSPLVSNKYYVSVNTTSMAAPLGSNTYLSTNNLTNQIKQYDIAVCDKYENQPLSLYDIILFKKDNKLIIHRIVEIKDEYTFITQGDNNIKKDDFEVYKQEIMGIYTNSLKFMSFINYLGYTPGFYVLFVGVTYDIGALLFFELKREKLKKQYIENYTD